MSKDKLETLRRRAVRASHMKWFFDGPPAEYATLTAGMIQRDRNNERRPVARV